jgi:hypothetical protein
MTETTDPNVPEWSSNPAHYAVDQHRPDGGTLTHLSIVSKAAPNLLFASYTDDGLNGLLANARDEERYDPHSDKLPSDRAVILAALRNCGIEPDESEEQEPVGPVEARVMAVVGEIPVTDPQGYTPPPARDPHERRVMPALEDESEDGERLFVNRYRCPACGCQWEDEHTSQCDDDCPKCGHRHVSPYESVDAEPKRDVLVRFSEALMVPACDLEVTDSLLATISDAYDEILSLRAVLDEAIQAWPAYDADPADDCEINGGDMVEWFGTWRAHAKTARGATEA